MFSLKKRTLSLKPPKVQLKTVGSKSSSGKKSMKKPTDPEGPTQIPGSRGKGILEADAQVLRLLTVREKGGSSKRRAEGRERRGGAKRDRGGGGSKEKRGGRNPVENRVKERTVASDHLFIDFNEARD